MMVSPVRPSKKHYDSSSSSSSYGSFSSSDSDVSASSVRASMERPVASIEVIRCLRCARCVEMTTTDDASMYGMIRVGTGIYYCDRCARMTGYGKQWKIYPMATDHNHTKPTLADEEMEAYQSVSTMPTTPEKFDPSAIPLSIMDGLGGLKGIDE
ncbi:hypothetical protein INS49_015601 [Diaporthe citri]|uniref:uncharacterized protein n=1 Tax=Diaporthe citri TaxID=83186 RepID=UPI001C80AFDE|nr:uncharacterized protein INS49_015601 [Diaporthe citri]KAG6356214.1 hypothetical protein INS49_015601 [Diaporthe citri]